MSALASSAPESLYSDDGETVWVRADLMTRSQARYRVWNPRGTWFLPHDQYPCRLVDVRVRKQWMRETGHCENPDWFTKCDPQDEGAVAYWKVTAP